MNFKNIISFLLFIAIISFIGIPSGVNYANNSSNKIETNSNTCLNSEQTGTYNNNYCCGGTYAVELAASANSESNQFMCLSLEKYPILM